MESLQNLLSPNSNIKSTVAQAETAIKLMRTNGYNDQADLFESQIRDAIASKNGKAFSGNVSQLFAFQKKASVPTPKPSDEKKSQEYSPDDLAMRIQDSLSMADERNIDIPNSKLSRVASLLASGDTKKASEQYGEISDYIEKSLAIQMEESRKPLILADGTQVEVGEKSGIRYMGGQPVSKGAINADVFNSIYQKNAEAQQEKFAASGIPIASQIPLEASQQYKVTPVEGVEAQPQVYAAAEAQKPTLMEAKQEAFKRAREAYRAGDDATAVDIVNSAGGKGVLGMFMIDDLERTFGARQPVQDKKNNEEQKPSPTKTSGGTIFNIKPKQ